MTPVEIRGAIMFITGEKPNDFAESRGIHRTTLHRVINGELQTEHVRRVISEGIGLAVDEIWPEEQPEKKAA